MMPVYDCGSPDCLTCKTAFRDKPTPSSTRATRRILTFYDPPPIPHRNMDWHAVDDATYAGDPGDPIGYGATEADAVTDLLEKLEA